MNSRLWQRLRWSAVAGILAVVGIVILELLLVQIRPWTFPAVAVSWLLSAGAALTLSLGFDKFHDFVFWGISLTIDWLVFAALFFVARSLREKKSN